MYSNKEKEARCTTSVKPIVYSAADFKVPRVFADGDPVRISARSLV